jgi:hypothetical protein
VREKQRPEVGDPGPVMKDGHEKYPPSTSIAETAQDRRDPVTVIIDGQPVAKARPHNLTFSADTRNRNIGLGDEPTAETQASAHPLAVYAGRECIGFIRSRGDAFEALDLDRRSIGLFSSRSAAADAIEETRR